MAGLSDLLELIVSERGHADPGRGRMDAPSAVLLALLGDRRQRVLRGGIRVDPASRITSKRWPSRGSATAVTAIRANSSRRAGPAHSWGHGVPILLWPVGEPAVVKPLQLSPAEAYRRRCCTPCRWRSWWRCMSGEMGAEERFAGPANSDAVIPPYLVYASPGRSSRKFYNNCANAVPWLASAEGWNRHIAVFHCREAVREMTNAIRRPAGITREHITT